MRGAPRNTGPAVNAIPVPLTTPQCCTHRTGVKCVHANTCPCRAANIPCTSGCPSENCHNWGPTRAPTVPRFKTNVSENIKEVQEYAPNLCHAIPPVVFHQDTPALSPRVLPRGDEWPDLLARADTAHTAPALNKTANPNPATPAAVGSSKINSNRARPTNCQTASTSLPVDQDSDVTLVASIGESNGDSDYVESDENSPTRPENTTDLEGNISELEEMHEVVEGELVKLA